MFDVEFDDLDLGAPRSQVVEWVAFAPPQVTRPKHAVHKRGPGRRKNSAARRAAAGLSPREHEPRNPSLTPPAASTTSRATRRSANQAAKQRQVQHEADALEPSSSAPTGHLGHWNLAQGRMDRAKLAGSSLGTPASDASACMGEARAAAARAALPPECDEGNVEYKLRLKANPLRFQQLVTQLKYRLSEGNGECFYYLGVEDDGWPRGLCSADMEASLATLHAMAQEVHASDQVLRKLPGTGTECDCVLVRVKRLCSTRVCTSELCIAVAGGADAGKSTLVAVLTQGSKGRPRLDDGQGAARMAVFRHKHEIESGRTSSLSHHLLGYDAQDYVLNYAGVAAPAPADIAADADKLLQFIDLGGHGKYLKTALFGMTCLVPDYIILAVAATRGLDKGTLEHLAAALTLQLPTVIVLTKVDMLPEAGEQREAASVIQASLAQSLPPCLEVPLIMSEAEAAAAAHAMGHARPGEKLPRNHSRMLPLFPVSSVTGAGIAPLHAFLRLLQPVTASASLGSSDAAARLEGACYQPKLHFQVDHTFTVSGVGTVVSGRLLAGTVSVGDFLMLGPLEQGCFSRVQVTGIQRAQIPVQTVMAGQQATLAIHSCRRDAPATPSGTPPGSPLDPREWDCSQPSSPVKPSKVDFKPAADRTGAELRHGSSGPQGSSTEARQARGYREHQQGPPGDLLGDNRAPEQLSSTAQQTGLDSLAASGSPCEPASSQHVDSQQLDQQLEESDQTSRVSAPAGKVQLKTALGKTRLENAGKLQEPIGPAEGALPAGDDAAVNEETVKEAAVKLLEPAGQAMLQQLGDIALQEQQLTPEELGQAWRGTAGLERRGSGSNNGLVIRSRSSPAILTSPPHNARKGLVLLDPAFSPHASWELSAVLVLLSGHWPARGLISGKWPLTNSARAAGAPGAAEGVGRLSTDSAAGLDEAALLGSSDGDAAGASGGDGAAARPQSGGRHKIQQGQYSTVLHCGSIRQAVLVVCMAEQSLSEDQPLPGGNQAGRDGSLTPLGAALAPCMAAAAIMQPCSDREPQDAPCVVNVQLRFQHRPEWVQPGQTVLMRDRTDNCLAAAGLISHTSRGC